MQTTLNRRFSSGLSLGMQYTWGHSIGDSGGSNEANTAGNPYNFQLDHGSNNFDVRHSFNLTALYDLPFGQGQQVPARLGAVWTTRSSGAGSWAAS